MSDDAILAEFLNSVKSTTLSDDSKIANKHVKEDNKSHELVNGDRVENNFEKGSIQQDSIHECEKIDDTFTGYEIFPEADNNLQPSRDRGKGRLMAGPGARVGGVQPRPTELRRAFFKLPPQYEMKLANARKFAMEQNVAHVLAKQKEEQIKIKKDPLANAALRHQVISLMSRVYVGGINFDVKEDVLRSVFGHYGIIKKIDFSWETPNVKHKGFAFIEFEVPDMAQLVLNSNTHHLIQGRPVKIGRPSNMPQATPFIDVVINESKKYPRVFVSNIHPDIVEDDLKSVFEAFGTIVSVDMPIDLGTMKHKGYAYIDYSDHKSANDASIAMHKFDIGGQLLKVGRSISIPNEHSNKSIPPVVSVNIAASIASKIQLEQGYNKKTNDVESSPSNVTIKPEFYEGTKFSEKDSEYSSLSNAPNNNVSKNGSHSTDSSTNKSEIAKSYLPSDQLPDNENANVIDESIASEEIRSIKGSDQRFLMMKKLAALRKQKQNVLVLRNMVLPDEIDDELEGEIRDECVKYGCVQSIVIKCVVNPELNVEVVKIFVEYDQESSAKAALDALNGRYFAGRVITVEIYDAMKFKYGDYSG